MRRLELAIDARQITGERKGIGRYLFSLLEAISGIDHEFHITLLFDGPPPTDLPSADFKALTLKAPLTYAWEQWALPRWLSRTRPDLFFAPANSLPLHFSCPTVLGLHDAMMFRPELSLARANRYYRYQARVLQLRAHSCRRIITVSNFSAEEITHFLGSHLRDRIDVIPEGVEPRFLAPPDPESLENFLSRHGLQMGYMLHFASAVPRKGTRLVLQALAKLQSDGQKLPRLFLPGLSNHDSVVNGWLQEYGISAITTGYLPEADLPLAYGGAGLLLYPSLWEGFGLPLLEGMAAGLPVIATNGTSIPELAGDCAWLIPPGGVEELCAIISHWSQYPRQASELGQKARLRARDYNWNTTASGVLQSLRKALAINR